MAPLSGFYSSFRLGSSGTASIAHGLIRHPRGKVTRTASSADKVDAPSMLQSVHHR